jgi:hypothetical protein
VSPTRAVFPEFCDLKVATHMDLEGRIPEGVLGVSVPAGIGLDALKTAVAENSRRGHRESRPPSRSGSPKDSAKRRGCFAGELRLWRSTRRNSPRRIGARRSVSCAVSDARARGPRPRSHLQFVVHRQVTPSLRLAGRRCVMRATLLGLLVVALGAACAESAFHDRADRNSRVVDRAPRRGGRHPEELEA